MKRFALTLAVICFSSLYAAQPDAVWITHSPREEISPKFDLKNGVFKIDASGQNGSAGQWQTRLAVNGGQHYRFSARRTTHAIDNPHRNVVERLIWLDAKGNKVVRDEPSFAYLACVSTEQIHKNSHLYRPRRNWRSRALVQVLTLKLVDMYLFFSE